MATPSLERAIRALLEPEIAGGLSAFDDVESCSPRGRKCIVNGTRSSPLSGM